MEQKQKIVEILIAAANEFTSNAANYIMKVANGEIPAEEIITFDTAERRAEFYAERLIEKGATLLPFKVGDKVAVRALCECVICKSSFEECRNICPFEDDCEFEDCDNANEKIFDTTIDCIFDNGTGVQLLFNDLIIEAKLSDLGTSFFVGENAHEQAAEYEKALAEQQGGQQ